MTDREIVLDIEGMTCPGCVGRVQRVLQDHPAVSTAHVSFSSRTAAVRSTSPDAAELIEWVERAGYRAQPHEMG